MLAVAARRFGAAAGPASLRFFATTPGVAPTWSGQVFKDSEHAREEDEKSLRKLLGKVKASAESGDKDAIKAHSAKEEAALHAIVDKYKPSAADVAALFAWRHSHEF